MSELQVQNDRLTAEIETQRKRVTVLEAQLRGEARGFDFSEWASKHKVFRRLFVVFFAAIFLDLYLWAKTNIIAGKLVGDWIGTAFIGSIVAGFVLIVQNYATNSSRD